jgi:hypothetical protein
MDALQAEYEKTALHRMGIPMERALARVSWLRGVLEGAPRGKPAAKPARTAGAR